MLRAQMQEMQREMDLLRKNQSKVNGGDDEKLGDTDAHMRASMNASLNRSKRRLLSESQYVDGGENDTKKALGLALAATADLERRVLAMADTSEDIISTLQSALNKSRNRNGGEDVLYDTCENAARRLKQAVVALSDTSALTASQEMGNIKDSKYIKRGLSHMQSMLSASMSAGPMNMRASLADNIHNIAREEELRTLKRELEECREDLKRDEEIFAEKVRELKHYRKQLRRAQQENSELQSRLSSMSAVQKLEGTLTGGAGGVRASMTMNGDTFMTPSKQAKNNKYKDAVADVDIAEAKSAGKSSAGKGSINGNTIPMQSPPSAKRSSPSANRVLSEVDLDISMAVAATGKSFTLYVLLLLI
jgi:hypothetical protein